MTADFYPLRVLLVALAGWTQREHQRAIEYLIEENRVLKAQVGSAPETRWTRTPGEALR